MLQEPVGSGNYEGCAPASLVFDPVFPLEEVKGLQELMVGLMLGLQ